MTDRNGEGISLLILSALRPLVPLNVTGLLFAWRPLAPIHLTAPQLPPSGTSCPKIEATSVGSCLEASLVASSRAQYGYDKAKKTGKCTSSQRFLCVLCTENVI